MKDWEKMGHSSWVLVLPFPPASLQARGKIRSFNLGQTDAPCNREGNELKMCSVFLPKALNQEHI